VRAIETIAYGSLCVDLPASFERHLRAENKSARTVQTYLEALRQLDAFLGTRGVDLADAGREDLEAFLAGLLARWRPATAANRYRALRVFYAWLEDEGEIPTDPMLKMKPPPVPEQPAPMLTEDLLRRLLATCAGRDFEARRDRALILLLLDTGGHRAEIGEMRLGDVNFEYDVILVVGKGGRERALPFGNRTGKAIDQYLRARHPMPTWSGSGSAARAG
jgi:integrase/recombinase XerC